MEKLCDSGTVGQYDSGNGVTVERREGKKVGTEERKNLRRYEDKKSYQLSALSFQPARHGFEQG